VVLPNKIAGPFGGKLYTQPSWLPVMEFPGGFASHHRHVFRGDFVRTGREHHAPIPLAVAFH